MRKSKLKFKYNGRAIQEIARRAGLLVRPLKSGAGFTAVELLVTLALFVVIITATISIFIRALTSERLITEAVKLNDNLSLALEQISREIRTGYDFCVVSLCTDSNVNFLNALNQVIEYRLGSGVDAGKFLRVVGGVPEAITGDDIEVIELKFRALTEPALRQPRISVLIVAAIRGAGNQSIAPVRLQTTVSSRNPVDA